MKRWTGLLVLLATLAAVACSGQSAGLAPFMPGPSPSPGISPTPSPSPSPSPTASPSPTSSPTTLVLKQGAVLGSDNQFSPTDGDTSSGGTGSNVVDGIACGPSNQTYHVHAHLSLLVSGVRIAIPDTIGMGSPGPEVSGFVLNAGCFYSIHTHDADGLIHVENVTPASYTLGELFDIWGQPLSTSGVAGFAGSVRVFIAQGPSPGPSTATNYTEYTGDPRAIVLASHEEITVEVGPAFVTPPSLPPVKFYTQF